MDRGAWGATVSAMAKQLDTTKRVTRSSQVTGFSEFNFLLCKKGDNNRVLSVLKEALDAKHLVRHLVHLRMLAVIMRNVL